MNFCEALRKIPNEEYCAKSKSLDLCLTVCENEIYWLVSGGGCGRGITLSYNIAMAQDWTVCKMNSMEKLSLNNGIAGR